MNTIDSTPEFVSKTYDKMSANLRVVRDRFDRPLGLADKVLLSHLDDPFSQELIAGSSYLKVRPDRVILQDVLGQTGMLQFSSDTKLPKASQPLPRLRLLPQHLQSKNQGLLRLACGSLFL